MSILTAANNDAAILNSICLALTSLKDVTILNSIISTLSNIADGTGVAVPLVVDPNWNPCGLTYAGLTAEQYEVLTLEQYYLLAGVCTPTTVTVQFFTDPEREDQLFSVNTDSDPIYFAVAKGNKLLFSPTLAMLTVPDSGEGVFLDTYYVTITESGSPPTVTEKTYSNSGNLLFQSVVVSTQKKPQFIGSAATCIVVPGPQKLHQMRLSDQLGYMMYEYDLCVQIPVFNWAKLSEQNRVIAGLNVANLVRLCSMQDPYRDGKCTFYSADIDGTFVSQFQFEPSKDMLKGCISVKCASYVSNTTF